MSFTPFSDAATTSPAAAGSSGASGSRNPGTGGRGASAAARRKRDRGGRNGLIRRVDQDVGMRDASSSRGGKRRSTASDLRAGSARPARGRANVQNAARVRGVAVRGSASKRKQNAVLTSRIETLRQYLRSRWNEPAKMLDLENMAADPILVAAGIKPPGAPGAAANLSLALFKLIKEMYPDIRTLSLACNNFKTLIPVGALPEFLPDLNALSLAGNDIKWTKDLHFGKKTLNTLTELVMTGNPVQQNSVAAGNEAGYRKEVLAKFPSLTMLDQIPVDRTAAEQVALLPSAKKNPGTAAAAAAHFADIPPIPIPLPTQPSFVFPPMDTDPMVSTFLDKFMNTTDSNVEGLKPAYDARAVFSYMHITPPPPRVKAAGFFHTMKRQKALRNDLLNDLQQHDIMRLGTHSPSRGIHVGPDSIIKFLRRLPQTRHPTTDPTKFVFDAWTIPSARPPPPGATEPLMDYFINVHGEFVEVSSGGLRSFDRTFLVTPAAAGSVAAQAGWPCTILSDELCLRQYAGIDAWTPKPNASAPAAAAAGGAAPAGLAPEQQAMVVRLGAETRMNTEFSLMCLSQNDWNYDAAKANFLQLQAANTIPPDAFTS